MNSPDAPKTISPIPASGTHQKVRQIRLAQLAAVGLTVAAGLLAVIALIVRLTAPLGGP